MTTRMMARARRRSKPGWRGRSVKRGSTPGRSILVSLTTIDRAKRSRQRRNDTFDEKFRHDSEKEHDQGGEQNDCLRKCIPSEKRDRVPFSSSCLENYLQNYQIIVKRDQTAEERQGDQPEQPVIRAGAKCSSEKIKLSEESGERWQPGQ